MAENSITMTEKGRTYTVKGDQVGRALACFTALSVLRIARGFVLALVGAGGVSAAIVHVFFR
jgi:hypothetical protein